MTTMDLVIYVLNYVVGAEHDGDSYINLSKRQVSLLFLVQYVPGSQSGNNINS
jgi:hypothetical protein